MKVTLLHFCFDEYTAQLANALVNYVDLTLIQPEDLAKRCKNFLNPAIRIHTFPKPRIRNPKNLLSMYTMMDIIQKSQPDVLHVQETNDPWYDLTLLLNQMPPLVTTIHDVFRHPGDKGAVPGSEFTRQVAFYRSQQLIVHAQLLKDALVQHFKLPQQRVSVLSHGELGSLYQKLAPVSHVAREPHTILFYGRIWPYKGLKYLLQAMPLVVEQIPDVKLIIAGRGENIEQYFTPNYDPKHYEILNRFIQDEEVAPLFQKSAAVILPYIEASQSGVAAVAYSMGTPVIASNIGGLAEMIRHERDGLLVPPSDTQALASSIIRLLSNPALQQQLQTAGLERSQNDLKWSNIAAQTIEVYKKAIFVKNQKLRNPVSSLTFCNKNDDLV